MNIIETGIKRLGRQKHLFCGPWFLYLFCYFAENEKISSIICSVCYNKR